MVSLGVEEIGYLVFRSCRGYSFKGSFWFSLFVLLVVYVLVFMFIVGSSGVFMGLILWCDVG